MDENDPTWTETNLEECPSIHAPTLRLLRAAATRPRYRLHGPTLIGHVIEVFLSDIQINRYTGSSQLQYQT